jgi:hypothetical protein
MNFLKNILEDQERLKTIKRVVIGVMAVLVVLDIFIHRHHEYFFWDKLPGFNAVLGLIACVAIIYIAFGVGSLLQKKEDFYD